MGSFNRKRILLVVTNSYAATNVIHSGLIQHLAQAYEVYIMSNLIRQKENVGFNSFFDINTKIIDIKIPSESLWIKVLRSLEKLLFFHFFEIETQEIKVSNRGFVYKFTMNMLLEPIKFLGLSPAFLKILRKKIISTTGNHASLNQLLGYGFQGIISSSPLDIRENTIVIF